MPRASKPAVALMTNLPTERVSAHMSIRQIGDCLYRKEAVRR